MKEIKELRKKNEKHFLNKDGTFTAYIYDKNIHYLKDGNYEEIDNTIIEEENFYSNKSNSFKISFPKENNNNLLNIENKNYKFLMKLSNKQNKRSNKFNISKGKKGLIYNNLIEDINFKYEVFENKIKESLILTNKNNLPNELTFIIETNLILEKLDNENIIAKDNDIIIYTIDKPFAIDSENKYNYNFDYELKKIEEGYLITLKLDKKWLEDKTTIFPVVIDPTIIVNEDNNVYDTYIYDGDTSVNRNNTDKLQIGTDSSNKIYRTLLKFNLPVIGTGCTVTSAYATIVSHIDDTHKNSIDYSHDVIDVHQVTTNWNETTADWSTMNDKYNSRIEGCSLPGRTIVNLVNETELEYELTPNRFDITNLVKKWYTGEPNYGIILKKHLETYDETRPLNSFYSKSHTETSIDPMPFLTVNYVNQNGLENYMSYEEVGFSNGSSYVNRYNGNMITNFSLNSTINGKFPVGLSLFYNTNDVILENDYGYGIGYNLNLHQLLKEEVIDEENYVSYLDEDGTLHYFYNNNEEYIDEDGLGLTLTKTNNNYYMEDNDKNKMFFIKNGDIWYLKEIEDTSNNKIVITYNTDNKISKIVDANNKEINITYEDNKTTITSDNKTTTINYTNEKVTSITNKYGTTSFLYNTNNIIEKITDISGKSLVFEYYDVIPYKTKKITEYGLNNTLGRSITFYYDFDSTSIVDDEGVYQTYSFNQNGNVINISNLNDINNFKDGYGKAIYYSSLKGKNNNKLLKENTIVKHVKNYIQNSSFEEENTIFTLDNEVLRTDSISNIGKYCLNIKVLNNSKKINAEFEIPKGSFYTFSCYIKGLNKVSLKLYYTNNDDEVISNEVSTINNEDFTRYDVTLEYKNDAKTNLNIEITGEQTEFFIDDIQLEQGKIANYYNIIDNSDFSNGFTSWEINTTTVDDMDVSIPTDEIITLETGNKALMLKADPYVEKVLRKKIYVNGKKGDTYNLSFCYKNTGINPMYETSIYGNFDIALIRFNYPDYLLGGESDASELRINNKEWQYFQGSFTAIEDHDYFEVVVLSTRNANSMYLTNFSLFKDLSGASFTYDTNGNILGITGENNETTTFEYDKNNQLLSAFSPNGSNLKIEYDNEIKNRAIQGLSSLGIANKIIYDSNNNPIKTIIKNVKIDLEQDNQECYIRSKGTYKYFDYNPATRMIDLKENVCSYDSFILEKTDTNFKIKHAISLKYIKVENEFVVLTSEENASIFTLTECKNGSFAINEVTSLYYLYNNNNLVKAKQLTSEKDINDDENIQFFIEKTDGLYIETNSKYSSDGIVIEEIEDSLSNKTSYDISSITNLTNSVTDSNNNITSYSYNTKDQITNVIKDDVNVNYSYNEQNLLEKITTTNKEYSFIYDNFLNKYQIKVGDNILVTNTYDEKGGKLLSSTYGNNDVVNLTYDDMNRVSKKTTMNNIYNIYYDNLGNVGKIEANNDIYKYKYDFAKRIKNYNFNKFQITYDYGTNNSLIKKTYTTNKETLDNYNVVNYNYNDDDILTNINYGNNNINYIYDELGRLIEKNINGNSQYKTEYLYETNGKRTSMIVKLVKIGSDTYRYIYDRLYNITHIYKNEEIINEYQYDKFSQLVKENNYLLNKTIRYKYDQDGNILSKKEYEINTYNLLNNNTYSYEDLNWKDKLTKYNDEEITCDNIGNPITIGNKVLTWTNGRELATYQDTLNNLSVSYKYNKDGIRIEKIVNNVPIKYEIEQNKVIYETRGDNIIYYLRDVQGQLEGFKYNNEVYYYVKNIQNDIIGILDSNLNKVATYEYDSWGNVISIKDSNNNEITSTTHIAIINPFRYRSYYYDIDTGLYYLNSRYYNPAWGRFINADSIITRGTQIGSQNMYAYCDNNPISLLDEDGYLGAAAAILLTMVVGAIAGAGAQFISDITTSLGTGKIKLSSFKTYFFAAAGGAVGSLFGNPFAGVIVESTISSVGSNVVENITSETKKNTKEIIKDTIEDIATGLLGELLPIKVNKITIGRNSWSAVFKSGVTKLKNQVASKMSGKVFMKGVASEIVNGLGGNIVDFLMYLTEKDEGANLANYCSEQLILWC